MKPYRLNVLERLALSLYSLVFYVAMPLLLWRLFRRSQTQPDYFKRKRERWGWGGFPSWAEETKTTVLWVHAVSVGETLAAKSLIDHLLSNSDYRLVITCSTPTGSEQIQRLFAEALASGQAYHCYAPYDTPKAVKRFLRRTRPNAYLILETELWPNSLRLCAKQGVHTFLVNGRLSEKSARAYGKVSYLTRPMLGCLSQALVQTHREGQRFEQLGLAADRWQATGSIKLDVCLSEQQYLQVDTLKSAWQLNNKPVLIAASTHPTEEALILIAWLSLKAHFPDAVLLLAPRHIDRTDEVWTEIQTRCSDQTVVRRSQIQEGQYADIILVDTLGELSTFFGLATVAVMGGTFVERGGHNFVEPALWQIPTVCGLSDFNFAGISQQLQHCGNLKSVESSPEAIIHAVSHWWQSDSEREQAGNAGADWVAKNRGALKKVIAEIERCF